MSSTQRWEQLQSSWVPQNHTQSPGWELFFPTGPSAGFVDRLPYPALLPTPVKPVLGSCSARAWAYSLSWGGGPEWPGQTHSMDFL